MVVEDIVFRKHDPSGTVSIEGDHWPQYVEFSREFLDQAAPAVIRIDDGMIWIRVSNGWAKYKITGTRPGTGIVEPMIEVVEARLIDSHVANEEH